MLRTVSVKVTVNVNIYLAITHDGDKVGECCVWLFEEDVAVAGHHLTTVDPVDSEAGVADPARSLLLALDWDQLVHIVSFNIFKINFLFF